jgi:hypothetical protein
MREDERKTGKFKGVYRVKNGPEYNAGLIARGNVMLPALRSSEPLQSLRELESASAFLWRLRLSLLRPQLSIFDGNRLQKKNPSRRGGASASVWPS